MLDMAFLGDMMVNSGVRTPLYLLPAATVYNHKILGVSIWTLSFIVRRAPPLFWAFPNVRFTPLLPPIS